MTTVTAELPENTKPTRGSDLSPPYIGRFAPSPTGPLHFGSLVVALGSWLDARSRGGLWLLRVEDLDPPREQPGASESILRTLELFDLHWDGEVSYQSRRLGHYEQALAQLTRLGLVYPCACSRKDIATRAAELGLTPTVYPGTCRNKKPVPGQRHALRIRCGDKTIEFADRIQGPCSEALAKECGDFVIRRRDGLFAYQLAVVVDDFLQQVTDVVRGADLLDNTARQTYLQDALGFARPTYMHLPVVLNDLGEKLSKQTGADPVVNLSPSGALLSALRFLDQDPPKDLSDAPAKEILQWAVAHWGVGRIRHADHQ